MKEVCAKLDGYLYPYEIYLNLDSLVEKKKQKKDFVTIPEAQVVH
jgi:hypothetical protein